jgi:ABC-type Zn2+ transport system substrate-binding protein/surface adhesin
MTIYTKINNRLTAKDSLELLDYTGLIEGQIGYLKSLEGMKDEVRGSWEEDEDERNDKEDEDEERDEDEEEEDEKHKHENYKDSLFNKAPIYDNFLKTILGKIGYRKPSRLSDIIDIRNDLKKR